MNSAVNGLRESAEAGLREMVAHLNVMNVAIDVVAREGSLDRATASHDLLRRLELLTSASARLGVPDMPVVADALEALVLRVHVRRANPREDVVATLRHGVDILMLMTHDALRRRQGHPPAELRGATHALLGRVERLLAAPADRTVLFFAAATESPRTEESASASSVA